MKFKTRKQLKQELSEAKADNLYYRGKLSMIEANLRKAKEKKTNIYITYRELRDIIYSLGTDKNIELY